MTQQEFIVSLEEKGIVLSEKQIEQFEKYYEILVEWNEKMNLTAITDREGVYLKHFQLRLISHSLIKQSVM